MNTTTFTLPGLPPSVNQLYYWYQGSVRLRDEVRQWKSEMKLRVRPFWLESDSVLCVNREYWYPWRHGNGEWVKRDVSNFDKCLFDLIAEKTGIDDRRIKFGMMSSRNSPVERTVVVLREVMRAEWDAEGGMLKVRAV